MCIPCIITEAVILCAYGVYLLRQFSYIRTVFINGVYSRMHFQCILRETILECMISVCTETVILCKFSVSLLT